MPDGITEVTPTRNAFYDVEVVTAKLDEPIIADDGDEITEGVDQVVYTARTPLPDGQRDTFELSLQIPEDAAGQTLAFPTIQTCEEGSTAWTEVAADGQTEDDLEHPAPSFVVTAATGSGGADGTPTRTTATTRTRGAAWSPGTSRPRRPGGRPARTRGGDRRPPQDPRRSTD